MINNTTTLPITRTLDEIEGTDLPLVGGKAYRLAMLRQHKLNVPPGLVLTTHFFEQQLQAAKLTPLWAGSPDVEVTTEALSWLADVLKTKPIAKSLAQPLTQQLKATFPSANDSFAVRSSAIDEDQRDHSFAGVHLTELGVPRVMLPVAITRCWASALCETATKYRLTHGMSIQGIRIAVLIQPMLFPEISGVGFTLNPLTGLNDEFVIEVTPGLGEALVSGDVQPYFYRVANQPPIYPILEEHAGNDTTADSSRPLNNAEITTLIHYMQQVQALMGEAQDIEWAKESGKFFMLQTRPISTTPQTTALDQEWTRSSYPEFLPELPSPLFSTILDRAQRCAPKFFEQLGVDTTSFTPYVSTILGRPYLNLSLLKKVMSQLGINPSHALYHLGYVDTDTTKIKPSIDWSTVWQKRQNYRSIYNLVQQAETDVNAYYRYVEQTIPKLEKLSLSKSEIQTQLRLPEQLYGEYFQANLALTIAISAFTAIGSNLLTTNTEHPASLISTLALQTIELQTNRLNDDLIALAHQAKKEPVVQTYFEETTSFETYRQTIAGTDFLQQFGTLLKLHQYRATHEADLASPRYPEDPTILLLTIQQHIQRKTSDTASEQSRQPIKLGWRNRLVNPVLNRLRQLLLLQDQLNDIRARAMTFCRHWMLQLGEKWVKQGWLVQPTDIFWLTLDDIEHAVLIEKKIGQNLMSTVRVYQSTYQTYADIEMPFTLWESQLPAIQFGSNLKSNQQSEVVVGLPISPGQVRGTVLVLQHPDQFERISDDIILVTPSTNPTWLPLLNLVDGLIVEVGGLLSHGSVIAREYGLPGVANIPQATQRFQTGDVVLVDGSTGVIQILEQA